MLKNSKTLKFLAASFVVAALAFAMSASAAYDFGTTTLKVGSKGEFVKTLQTLVGATPADGIFGNGTKAKVMAWQAANGLTADGAFGPMSMAKANATATGSFPAGCTSNTGFSTTTGASCASTATSFPAGCTSAAGFSSTTGASCSGSAAATGALTGGAGSITLTETATDVESDMIEGQNNTKVLGFKVEATDSDLQVTNIKVTLENTNDANSSYRLNRYVDGVSVWMGTTKVGSAKADDFTKSGVIYSKSIALSNAVIRMGSSKKATFYVTVDGVSNIDTGDMDATWDVTVDNVRYQDATGVIMTTSEFLTGDGIHSVGVDTLSGSGDVKLAVSKDASSPALGNVEVSDTTSTSDVLLLAFKLKDTGSDMTFDQITVHLDGTIGGGTAADMIGELTLKEGSNTLASYTALTAADDQDVTFDLDETYTLSADSTKVFKVYAKINDITNFDEGDSMIVSMPADDGIAAEDSNGDVVVETGSATGFAQTFYSTGAQVTYVSDSFTAEDVTNTVDGTISMKFKVTAFGDNDVVIGDDASGLAYTLGNGTINETDAIVTSNDLTAQAGDFTVTAGDTATFTLSVKFNGTDGFVQLTLDTVDGTDVANIKTAAH